MPPKSNINESEILFTFIRASGPGGQNVNKVATGVLLRFNVNHSTSFSDEVRVRLISMIGKKLTREGDLLIKAIRFRTQERNKLDAINRLYELIAHAEKVPKKRQKTKPTYASKQKRLGCKKNQSKIKVLRSKDKLLKE